MTLYESSREWLFGPRPPKPRRPDARRLYEIMQRSGGEARDFGPFHIEKRQSWAYQCWHSISLDKVPVVDLLLDYGHFSFAYTKAGVAKIEEIREMLIEAISEHDRIEAEKLKTDIEIVDCALLSEGKRMTLYEATRDLHHACEAHPVGQRMALGTVTRQEWADWLAAFRVVHVRIDPEFPDHLRRVALLDADLALLPPPRPGTAAQALADSIASPDAENAAAYVLHGAHRRGGRVLQGTMSKAGLPTAHVGYPLPAETEAFVVALRGRADIADAARTVFAGLLSVMDEIEAR